MADCVTCAYLADRLAVSLGRSAKLQRNLAAFCEQTKQWDVAEALFRALLDADPADREAALGHA